MLLNDALKSIPKCDLLELQDHSVFQLIAEKEFYFQTSVKLVSEQNNNKFILLSAPGAVGKTSLAKYIAREYHGFYWNVGRKVVNGTSFAGELAHAVGLDGTMQNEFISGLRTGKNLVILDAFDEAALISGREGVKDFLIEIGDKILDSAQTPTVVLTARTEMAAFIRDVCVEHGFGITHYSIEYFEEGQAPYFIEQYLDFQGKKISSIQRKEIQKYLETIKNRIHTRDEVRSFMGYAQVLQILCRKIEKAIDDNELTNSLSFDHNKENNLIYEIVVELIDRERKKLDEFKASIRPKYQDMNKVYVVDNLYSKKEQLTRLQWFALAGGVESIRVEDFDGCIELIPEDKDKYLELLKDWLPQHVFLRDNKIMPIFSDYLFAESLLDADLSLFAEEYQINGKAFRLPTRIFMDCYLALNNFRVNSKDIFFLDAAYRSKNSMDSMLFCEIKPVDIENQTEVHLIYTDLKAEEKPPVRIPVIREMEDPIVLNRVENMSINVEAEIILTPGITKDVVIHQAFIECDKLKFQGQEIRFETYGDEENVIVVHKIPERKPDTKIAIKGTKRLQVDFPIEQNHQLKGIFHELNPFFYRFDNKDEESYGNIDIKQFAFGLKKVLEQFKTDSYPGGPGKHKEKINSRCRTGIKKKVLEFLKACNVIYEDDYMYMCSLEQLSTLRVNRESYVLIFSHKKYEAQLRYAYEKFLKWLKE